VFNLNNRIRNNELNWIYQAERVQPEFIPKQLMGCAFRGMRSVARPEVHWKD
jgi:hypothetical protein